MLLVLLHLLRPELLLAMAVGVLVLCDYLDLMSLNRRMRRALAGRAVLLGGTIPRMTQIQRFRDFTQTAEPLTFRIDADVFEVKPAISLDTLAELADLADGANKLTPRQQIEHLREFFVASLEPASADRFLARMAKDTDAPIGMGTIIGVMQWLMEAFTALPIQPSNDSAVSSSDGGTSSTDGVSPTDPIL